jgi:ribosome recycling factor
VNCLDLKSFKGSGSVFFDLPKSKIYNVYVDLVSQVANINAADARTLTVTPWEKNMLGPIEKAIMIANLGLNPMNNGENIIINIPALTEERRRDLAKQSKHEAEEAKIGIRNHRKDANTDIKKQEKEGVSEDVCKVAEETIQKLTDSFIKKVEEHLVQKEAEIMKV